VVVIYRRYVKSKAMAKNKKQEQNIDAKINRQDAKEQGFYDGRFRSKVVPDKKKKDSKTKARKKVDINE
jgi:hypothetical protein